VEKVTNSFQNLIRITFFCLVISRALTINAGEVNDSGIFSNTFEGTFSGVTPLMSSTVNGDIDGVRFFAKGGLVVNQKNLGGASALNLACREGNPEIVEILIKNGADVNSADNEGWTPLMRASMANNAKVVSALLSSGADAGRLNFSGETAIIHSSLSDCTSCLNEIFRRSSLITSVDKSFLKEQLANAFIIAKNKGNKPSQDAIEGYLDAIIKTSPIRISESQKNSGYYGDFKEQYKYQEDPKIIEEDIPQKNNISKNDSKLEPRAFKEKNYSQKKFKFVVEKELNTEKFSERNDVVYKTEKTDKVYKYKASQDEKNISQTNKIVYKLKTESDESNK
jgi:hypothetical protein